MKIIKVRTKNDESILYTTGFMANFLLKFPNFRYLGNRGWCDTNFVCTVKFAEPENPMFCVRIGVISSPELSMGWVDPWVGLGRDFSVFGGLGWVHYRKSTKNLKGLR